MAVKLNTQSALRRYTKIVAYRSNTERKIERLEEIIKENASRADHHGRLEDTAEKMLLALANNDGHITKERLISHFKLPRAKGDYLFDVLEQRDFAMEGSYSPEGAFWFVTRQGRAYLAHHNLL